MQRISDCIVPKARNHSGQTPRGFLPQNRLLVNTPVPNRPRATWQPPCQGTTVSCLPHQHHIFTTLTEFYDEDALPSYKKPSRTDVGGLCGPTELLRTSDLLKATSAGSPHRFLYPLFCPIHPPVFWADLQYLLIKSRAS